MTEIKNDREKVIKGMERMLEDSKYNDSVNWNPWADTETLEAAIALLKADEPRLLKLDEIKVFGLLWLESRNGFAQPVICQNYEYGVDRSVEFIMIHGTICNSINTFGKLWRVWTSEPTEEQRKAVAWE